MIGGGGRVDQAEVGRVADAADRRCNQIASRDRVGVEGFGQLTEAVRGAADDGGAVAEQTAGARAGSGEGHAGARHDVAVPVLDGGHQRIAEGRVDRGALAARLRPR